jgi:putative ABC transport system permease protein
MNRAAQPPRLSRWLLHRAMRNGGEAGSIEADLYEEFRQRHAASPRAARAWYRTEVRSLVARYGIARHGASVMDMIWYDIRQAARALAAARALTVTAVATLAIGLGAAVAIFALVDGVLIRPLPFHKPDQLIWARNTLASGPMSLSWPDSVDWQARQRVFEATAVTSRLTESLTGTGDAARLDGREATWRFLRVLGVQPAIGRDFTEDDATSGATHLILISDHFWRARFSADAAVVGRAITLNSKPHTIIGVMPPGFVYFAPVDFIELKSPATLAQWDPDRGNHNGLSFIARLKPGATEVDAHADLTRIAAELEKEYPNTNSGAGADVETLTTAIVGDVRPTLAALLGSVGVLLLLACASIANLLIARGTARGHELSIRAALGCGRGRLIRQLLVESLMLALAGGVLGAIGGGALLRVLVSLLPADTPRLLDIGFSPAVLAFAAVMTTVSALMFGVLPALMVSGARGQEALIRSSRSGKTTSQAVRRLLLIGEIALALVLLVGAALMAQTLRQLFHVDPGFDRANVVSMRVPVQGPQWTAESLRAFQSRLLDRAGAMPGVTGAAITTAVPLDGSDWNSVFIAEDKPVPPRADIPSSAFTIVSANYQRVLRLRLERGRFFNESDTSTSPQVTVINRELADRIWPGENPVGKRLKQGWPEWKTPWREVIGVVSSVKTNGVSERSPMEAYLPVSQNPAATFALIARADWATRDISTPLRKLVQELDPNLPVYQVQSLDAVMGAAISWQRLSLVVIGAFGAIAVLVACIGLYGIVSHSVIERRQEIGIRLALGATASRIQRSFVGQALVTAAAGTATGVAIAWFAAQLLEKVLFNVKPRDLVTFATVSALLMVVTAIASYLPARRAASVPATTAMREE